MIERGSIKGWTNGRMALLFLLALVSMPMLAGHSAAANRSDREVLTRSPDHVCVHAGLTLPTIVSAYMIHPGQRRHPDSQGKRVMQEVYILAQYPEMPQPECADYRRLGRVEVQKQAGKGEDVSDGKKDGWATMQFRGWIYSRDKAGIGGVSITPTGHEAAGYYWKPGQVVRAKFDNIVRFLPTGKTFTSKRKTVQVEIRGSTSNRQALAARSHASLSWTLLHVVSEGAPIPFSWTASHLGKKHRLVVQRPVGTARTWQTIMRLRSNSGSAKLSGLPLGKYRLRLADLSGHRVLAQQVAGIGVFGQVPFSTLFRDYGEGPGVYTTPSASFPYIYWSGAGDLDSPSTAFSVEHNHCLSVHVAFVPGYPNLASYYDKSTVTGTVAVVQESRDPVSASAPYDGTGSVDAELVPGQTWSVIASHQGEFEPLIYLNGYAICSSTESFFR